MQVAHIPADAHLAGILIGASVWFRALKESVRGVCRGLGRFGVEALFNWTERVGLLAAGFAVIALGGSLTAVGLVFFVVRAARPRRVRQHRAAPAPGPVPAERPARRPCWQRCRSR